VSHLSTMHGTMGVVEPCALLFAEETGVPLPLPPGDLSLLAAGLLIATGNLCPRVFVRLAIGSTSAGLTSVDALFRVTYRARRWRRGGNSA